MFDFFDELEEFFNSFLQYIYRTAGTNSTIWGQFKDSRIFEMLMHYRNAFPQPISWAIFIVIFTSMLEFERRGRP